MYYSFKIPQQFSTVSDKICKEAEVYIMKVYFHEEIKQIENTNDAITELLEDINSYLEKTDLIFSHLNIDSIDVYEYHEQYLLDKLDSIEKIIVILKTTEEVAAELQQSLNEYLERALPVIENLSDQFYQGESEQVWIDFADLTDGLQWIISAVQTLSRFVGDEVKTYYSSVSEKIESVLQELLEALEVKDTVTIADMIQYEIVETLAELKQNVHH